MNGERNIIEDKWVVDHHSPGIVMSTSQSIAKLQELQDVLLDTWQQELPQGFLMESASIKFRCSSLTARSVPVGCVRSFALSASLFWFLSLSLPPSVSLSLSLSLALPLALWGGRDGGRQICQTLQNHTSCRISIFPLCGCNITFLPISGGIGRGDVRQTEALAAVGIFHDIVAAACMASSLGVKTSSNP